MDPIDRLIRKETIDDDDIWRLDLDRLNACRLEEEASLGPKITLLEGANETIDILARIRDVPDGVEGIGRRFDRGPVWLFVREETKDLPLHLWELARKHLLTEI